MAEGCLACGAAGQVLGLMEHQQAGNRSIAAWVPGLPAWRVGISQACTFFRLLPQHLPCAVCPSTNPADLWYNPTVEEQAIDRAHRIGQTKPVHVTRITIEGALEGGVVWHAWTVQGPFTTSIPEWRRLVCLCCLWCAMLEQEDAGAAPDLLPVLPHDCYPAIQARSRRRSWSCRPASET